MRPPSWVVQGALAAGMPLRGLTSTLPEFHHALFAVGCAAGPDSTVDRQRSPGKTARRAKVGNLAWRLGEDGTAGASRNGGAGNESDPLRSAHQRPRTDFSE